MLAAFFSVLVLAATQSMAAPAIVSRQEMSASASDSSASTPASASASGPTSTRTCRRKGSRPPGPSGFANSTTVVSDTSSSASATVTETDLEQFPSFSDDSASAAPTDAPSSFIGNNNAAIVTSSAVTTASQTPGPAPSGPPEGESSSTGDEFADQMLKLHNDFRAQYGADPLTWNADAAAFAQSWASKCKFEHSGNPDFGENLAAGTGEGFDGAAGFSGWANESSLYDYNDPVFSEAAGHFTAVVWKATTQVGCALVDCPNGSLFDSKYNAVNRFLSCNYANVPGNVKGQFTDNVGRKA